LIVFTVQKTAVGVGNAYAVLGVKIQDKLVNPTEVSEFEHGLMRYLD